MQVIYGALRLPDDVIPHSLSTHLHFAKSLGLQACDISNNIH